jgi:hypothetical protein
MKVFSFKSFFHPLKRLLLLKLFPSVIEPNAPVVRILQDKTSSKSFSIEWDPPTKPRGTIKSYKVAIRFLSFSYFVPDRCDDAFEKSFEERVSADSENRFMFQAPFPFANYVVQVFSNNSEAMSGPSDSKYVETLTGISVWIFLTRYLNLLFLESYPG